MSNTSINPRISTLNGKKNAITNAKTFGQTISDRSNPPNIIQTTFIPATISSNTTMLSIQQCKFLLGCN